MIKPKRTPADFKVESVEISEYVYAGTSRAMEHLGGDFADVSCACCGAKISHVFVSNVGPLGGDCAASLTGDNATRSAMRRALPVILRKIRSTNGFSLVSSVRVEPTGTIWATLRETGREIYLGAASNLKIARMLAAAAIERMVAEYPAGFVPHVPTLA